MRMTDRDQLTQLERMLSQGQLTRREFLAGAAALGLTAAISPALLSTPARASAPKKGGRFRIGVNDFSTSSTLDPELNETQFQMMLNFQIRNCLVEVGPGGKLVPELAESWESSPDAKKWTIKLRKGVEFHNGKTMDAQDVIYSINLHKKEKTRSVAKPFVAQIKDIKADGKHTVVFHLEKGNVDLPAIMTVYALLIVPAGTTDFDKGMGTGGYILESFKPGVRSFVKRNPNYWKEGRAHFDEVEMIGISDATARNNALMTGQIDAMNFVDLRTAHLLEKKPGVKLIRVSGKMHFAFPMRTDLAPFDNNDVRMALKYAIDRESVLKVILAGYGSLGNDQPLSPAYRFYTPDIPQRMYDPDKAKYHMKKAGIGDYTFKIHASNLPFAGAVDAAVLFGEHAAKAGIKIEAVRAPEDGYWSEVWLKKPWCASRWSGRVTEDIIFSTIYSAASSWNETYFKHERFEELLAATRIEFDEAKRHEMYAEMQRIIHDEGGAVISVFADFVDAASEKIKFGELASDWALDGVRAAERWWFES